MNLEELTSVWRSQDAAPLHDVNKTLLHLALRQDEAKLQRRRRIEIWATFAAGAFVVAVMAALLGNMLNNNNRRNLVTGLDFAITIGGAAAALLAGGAVFVFHRAQARREQHFGESLRDQLNRRLAQLDDWTMNRGMLVNVLFMVTLGGICPTAFVLLSLRTNQKSLSDNWLLVISMIVVCVWSVATSVWQVRRQMRDVVLPRKRQLEALLKELDGQ